MSATETSDKVLLHEILDEGFQPFGVAASTILIWLMYADDQVKQEERDVLNDFLSSFNLSSYRSKIEKIIQQNDLKSLELAAEILRRETTEEGKRRLIELYLGMALADGLIAYTEIFVIEFIADLFSISPSELRNIYRNATGREMPNIGDPSSESWWARQSKQKSKSRAGNNKGGDSNQNSQRSRSGNQTRTKRMKALAILGLEEGATEKEIKKAFRRLTKVHHPDRFATLGEEAKENAHHTYIRIKEAYEYLSS